ncbi:16S rRNA (cytosine(1402)-N(4))-methyltransferase RsmH [bacterium]|nr:16S rRNA (cytosine(1402)-N(4))-methyltransferase RsmH [bacterium]
MEVTAPHSTVMLNETIKLLAVKPAGVYLDATVGTGGCSRAILDSLNENGRLISIDLDEEALKIVEAELGKDSRISLVHGNFSDCKIILSQLGISKLDGMTADLGLSSLQLDSPLKGFSYRFDAPLDMRFDSRSSYTALDLIRNSSAQQLAEIIARYGEQRGAVRIAKAIKSCKPVATTQLAGIICKTAPRGNRDKILARVFQSFRIAVNRELENLQAFLEASSSLLKPGGRLATLSYHSLEDRIVKNFLKRESSDCICPPEAPQCGCGHRAQFKIITKKPVTPSELEKVNNPRSRSAKMRAGERI